MRGRSGEHSHGKSCDGDDHPPSFTGERSTRRLWSHAFTDITLHFGCDSIALMNIHPLHAADAGPARRVNIFRMLGVILYGK